MPISALRWHKRSRMPTALARPAALTTALAAALAVALSGCGHGANGGAGGETPASAGASRDAAVRTAVRALVADGAAPGAAVLVRDGRGTRFTAAGVADVRTGRRIHRNDHFRAGSLTKTVIAAVTLRLADQGRLRLDDTVERHLPGLVHGQGNDGRRITLRQLLTHTSGLYDYPADPELARQLSSAGTRTRTPASLVRTAVSHPPYFRPGSAWRYSNTNYVLLGMVIQRVTGHSYADEARRLVLRPLALDDTSFPGTRTTLPAPHGRAYSGEDGARRDVTDLNPSTAGAAGEMVSTLDDLTRLVSGLQRGPVLDRAGLRTMRDTSASHGRYGMGLFPVRLPCGVTLWGHNGEITGSYALAVATSDGRRGLAYRLNSGARPAPATESALLKAAFCTGS
ncbi:beta-lactamase family protein [Streptomyces sp. NA02950]|uniref:serine hydrolase domain-containing protein n=1 Tax=Streptomyces sp. NA02950 TaxID=2742137 RepID=UPI00159002A8|nr:serine hydrolase domain-containing protein [Streptomyces sp. NA02950]QKV93179.1 beta-lactamase family protein [Streptomyces sp. NA02950]